MKTFVSTSFSSKCAQFLAGLIAVTSIAAAQVPQPGIVLFGKVFNNGQLVTDGKIEWTYTQGNGTPVTIEAYLQELSSPGGETYSYTATIPANRAIAGFPSSARGLLFGDGRLSLTRSAMLGGQELQIDNSQYGTNFTLSAGQALGLLERVDLLVPSEADCCPGDADRSGLVNLFDYRAVRDAFGDASPQIGDANCDFFVNMADYASVRDHFGETCGQKSNQEKSFAPSTLVAAGRLQLVPDTNAINSGQKVTLSILASAQSAGTGVAGIFITYDAGVMRFDGGSVNGALFDDTLRTGTPRVVQPGVIAFSAGASGPLSALASAPVATLEFTALAEGKSVFGLGTPQSDSMLMDTDYNPIPVQLEGTTISVSAVGGEDAAPASGNSFILY